jgi:large conductance mechanosensitive channel
MQWLMELTEMAEVKKTAKKTHTGHTVVITLPPIKAPSWIQGFLDFVREQGVVGLAVGLILGIAAKSVVDSLVQNIFNPVIGLLYGGGDFSTKYVCLKSVGEECRSKLGYGNFINTLISFIIVAAAVYFVVKGLKLDKLDIKKE